MFVEQKLQSHEWSFGSPQTKGMAFGMNHLPILREASHTLYNKYDRLNFYLCHTFYTQNKSHNTS